MHAGVHQGRGLSIRGRQADTSSNLPQSSWLSLVALTLLCAEHEITCPTAPAHDVDLLSANMLDPIPPPPIWLSGAIKPVADLLSFQTLPYHVHEIIFAVCLYQTVQSVISPAFSSYVFPNIYPKLNRRTKLNWDVHLVSTVQSCLINTLALWVMFTDEERKGMSALERMYGYTGAGGLIQGLAAGYFLWDLLICTRHFKIFGFGLWAHAVCAVAVFSFGFVRPLRLFLCTIFPIAPSRS